MKFIPIDNSFPFSTPRPTRDSMSYMLHFVQVIRELHNSLLPITVAYYGKTEYVPWLAKELKVSQPPPPKPPGEVPGHRCQLYFMCFLLGGASYDAKRGRGYGGLLYDLGSNPQECLLTQSRAKIFACSYRWEYL